MSAEAKHRLDADAAKADVQRRPWTVFRQQCNQGVVEQPVCGHRFELLADLCAYRRTRQHPDEVGIHYTVRRAES